MFKVNNIFAELLLHVSTINVSKQETPVMSMWGITQTILMNGETCTGKIKESL